MLKFFKIFALVLNTCLLSGLFKQVHCKQSVSLPACLKTSRRQGFKWYATISKFTLVHCLAKIHAK